MLGFVSLRPTARAPKASISSGPIPLTELGYGQEAVVSGIDGPQWFRDRLHAVGLVPNAEIRVLRECCPLVLHLDGGRFSVRREDAALITVSRRVPEAA